MTKTKKLALFIISSTGLFLGLLILLSRGDKGEICDLKSEFDSWKQIYQMSFKPEEETTRFNNFCETHRRIEAHNRANHSYQLGLNQFSALSSTELGGLYSSPDTFLGQGTPSRILLETEGTTFNFTPIDWQKKGFISAVKNMDACGASVVFAATGLAESYFARLGNNITLSEQQMLDCQSRVGCSGGGVTDALDFLKINGSVLGSNYKYAWFNGKTAANATFPCKVATGPYKIPAWKFVNITINSSISQKIQDLRTALESGPFIITLAVYTDLYSYNRGIYWPYRTAGEVGGAAFLVVGIDQQGVLRLKNCWGTNWGENGYVRMYAKDVLSKWKSYIPYYML